MNFKDLFNKLFAYTPEKKYEFTIPSNDNMQIQKNFDENNTTTKNIYPTLSINEEYIKIKYNFLINSDIILRNFTINARGKQYNAFLLHIDGMVDNKILDDFILKPLMLRNKNNTFDGNQNKVISEAVTNNITVRKVKKFDLPSYLLDCLMPQNAVTQESTFENIISGINAGNCALFVDTLNIAFNIEVKGFKQRGVEKPENEIVIKGSHEAFVENIRTNTSLLRRIINNENLIIENVEVGQMTKTKCGVCYIKDLTNNDLINEVKFRLNNLDIDALLSSR